LKKKEKRSRKKKKERRENRCGCKIILFIFKTICKGKFPSACWMLVLVKGIGNSSCGCTIIFSMSKSTCKTHISICILDVCAHKRKIKDIN